MSDEDAAVASRGRRRELGQTDERVAAVAARSGLWWWPLRVVKVQFHISGQHRFGRIVAFCTVGTAAVQLLVALTGLFTFSNTISYVSAPTFLRNTQAKAYIVVTPNRMIEADGRLLFAVCGSSELTAAIEGMLAERYDVRGHERCIAFKAAAALASGTKLHAEGLDGAVFHGAAMQLVNATGFFSFLIAIGTCLYIALLMVIIWIPIQIAMGSDDDFVLIIIGLSSMLIGYMWGGLPGVLAGALAGAFVSAIIEGLVSPIADYAEEKIHDGEITRILTYILVGPIAIPAYLALCGAFVLSLLYITRFGVFLVAPHALYQLFIAGLGLG